MVVPKSEGPFTVDEYAAHPLSGQLECTISGTVYQFPNHPCSRILLIAHPGNAGVAWVGNVTGTVNNVNGYPLVPPAYGTYGAYGPQVEFVGVDNLNRLYANANTNGDRICWIIEQLN